MPTISVEPHKSSIGGVDANLMAIIAYVGGTVISWIPGVRYFAWLVPVVIFFIEKDSSFVKFHAAQSFVLNIIGAVLSFLINIVIGGIITMMFKNSTNLYASLGALGVVGFFASVFSLIITVFSVVAIYNAYTYKEYRIPVIGSIADALNANFSKK